MAVVVPARPPVSHANGDTPMSDDGDADESAAAAGGGEQEQEQEAEAPRADGRRVSRRATAGHATHDSQEGYGP